MSRRWFIVLLVPVLVYLGAAGWLYLKQDDMIFPRTIQPPVTVPSPVPDNYRRLSLSTPDGATLRGILALPHGPVNSPTLVIAFGGNAHDATAFALFLRNVFEPLGNTAVAAFAYRGYPGAALSHTAPASTGTPSEEALFADALQIHDTLKTELSPAQTIAIGYSLGTSVATWLASQRPLAGLVLVAPFTAMKELATQQYPWLKPAVSLLLRHPFATEDMLPAVKAPVTIFYSRTDGLIPSSQPEFLAKEALDAGTLREITAMPGTTHGTILDAPELPARLREALRHPHP